MIVSYFVSKNLAPCRFLRDLTSVTMSSNARFLNPRVSDEYRRRSLVRHGTGSAGAVGCFQCRPESGQTED